MGPGRRPLGTGHSAAARDPLQPPPFNGNGNPLQWARRVATWVKAHDVLVAQGHKDAMPKLIRGYLLSEVLYGTARRTVLNSLSQDQINSEDGVTLIVKRLVKFNPTVFAHEVFVAFKALGQVRRRHKEAFKSYVNRFEAAASELRGLTGQCPGGEAEQFLAFQLLEGADIPAPVFMNLLASCAMETTEPAGSIATQVRELKAKVVKIIQDYGPLAQVEAVDGLLEKLKDLRDSVPDIGDPIAIAGVEGFDSVTIDLERAKAAVRALDAVSPNAGPTHQDKQSSGLDRSAVESIVRQTLLSQSGRQKSTPPGTQTPSKSRDGQKLSRKEKIAKRKAKSTCKVCGKKGHWGGDPECEGKAGGQGSEASGAAKQGQEESDADSFFD